MYSITAYKGNRNQGAQIKQLQVHRDWMNSSTYNCFPITLANTYGYAVYFDEDVSFIWNGDIHTAAKGIKGKHHVWDTDGRGEGTVSFITNIVFKSDENISLLTMPVPNHPMEEATVLTSILTTSFFTGELSIAWRINPKFANQEITVPAGQPIAAILPISLTDLNNSTINIVNEFYPYEKIHDRKEYVDALHDHVRETGKKLNLYKKGIDEKGNKIGSHEVSKLILNVNNN